ncbi:MAG: phosphoglycerate dehydrogenase [Nitrospinae bacterium]|nr:phosphoglycerate dehydrogenase [Nitrospinota bacterium]
MKVLVSDKLSEKGIEILNRAGSIEADVKTGLTKEQLIAEIPQYEGLIVRSSTKVTADIINAAKNLKVIGRAGIGVDNVDVDAASKRGIVVMNTPEGNVITTAEHAIAMMLSLARKIPQASASVKGKKWEKGFMGVEVYNKTLGIIGLGRIGSIVANRAKGLSMNVIVYDPFISKERAKSLGVELVEMPELFKRSDFISIHVPKTSETAYLIGEKEFAMMKKGVRIINCARGGIVDEKSLAKAIKEKIVAGAALDVFEKEPVPSDNPLLELDEVICTPHLGASTDEAQVNVAIDIANQIVDFFKNGQIRNAVNVPSISADLLSRIQPYLTLGEKLGSLHAQLIEGGVRGITIKYSGDVVSLDVKPITISVIKGLLQVFVGEGVNMVNAPFIAKERGIEVVETTTSEPHDFASLISVTIKTEKQERVIEGTIFGKNDPRIVRIDEYWVEASPSGNMLIFSNIDTPGVIGKIGTLLGDDNINIAGMQLGRNKPRGNALSIVNVDSPIPEKTLAKIRSMPNIIYVKMVRL